MVRMVRRVSDEIIRTWSGTGCRRKAVRELLGFRSEALEVDGGLSDVGEDSSAVGKGRRWSRGSRR